MFSRAVRVATIRGIDVRLDPSLVLIALLVAWTFATRFTASYGTTAGYGLGAFGAVLFFASVLAHELGHALEARHRGIRVSGITLFLFGGVTEMEAHGHRPRDEFMIAAIGPWVSLVCGALFGLLSTTLSGASTPVAQPLAELAGLLGWLNVLLAVFNLVPGAPLDGGRVLRAGLWWLLDDRSRAIRITARIGQVLGLALVLLGVWILTVSAAAALGALWYVVIGAFLYSAARRELHAARLDDLYSRWTVGDLLGDLRGRWPASSTIDPDRLPRVELAEDLHAFVDAFQGTHDVVVVTRDGIPVAAVPEREAASAIARARRARGSRPPASPTAPR